MTKKNSVNRRSFLTSITAVGITVALPGASIAQPKAKKRTVFATLNHDAPDTAHVELLVRKRKKGDPVPMEMPQEYKKMTRHKGSRRTFVLHNVDLTPEAGFKLLLRVRAAVKQGDGPYTVFDGPSPDHAK